MGDLHHSNLIKLLSRQCGDLGFFPRARGSRSKIARARLTAPTPTPTRPRRRQPRHPEGQRTIDATSGPGRMNLSKTDRPAIFLISVTKVSFNLLFKEHIGAE